MHYLKLFTNLAELAFICLFIFGGVLIGQSFLPAMVGDRFGIDGLIAGVVLVAASMPVAVLYEWLEKKVTRLRKREQAEQGRVVTFL